MTILESLRQERNNLLERKVKLYDAQLDTKDRILGIANIAALHEMIASVERIIKMMEKTE